MIRITILLMLLSVLSCGSPSSNSDYHIVYKNDKDGNTLLGSKADLIQSVRSGVSIKIGWGVKTDRHSIEHISETIWLAILDESEVVAHLDPQVLPKTDWEDLSANYSDSTLLRLEWRVVITSKGEFDAVWYDRISGDVIQRRPQNHELTWFARGTGQVGQPLFPSIEK